MGQAGRRIGVAASSWLAGGSSGGNLNAGVAGRAEAHEIVCVKRKVGMSSEALDVVHLPRCCCVVLVILKRIFAERERGELGGSHLLPTRSLTDRIHGGLFGVSLPPRLVVRPRFRGAGRVGLAIAGAVEQGRASWVFAGAFHFARRARVSAISARERGVDAGPDCMGGGGRARSGGRCLPFQSSASPRRSPGFSKNFSSMRG